MAKNNTRLGRINEELKKEISHIISFELKDPNLTGLISVTRAKITPDLKYAQVYVSILNAKNVNKTMKALEDSSRIYTYTNSKKDKFKMYSANNI